MADLNIPSGADAGFRLVHEDAFGNSFSINIYGTGRRGWFVATLRDDDRSINIPQTPLMKGQWRTLLNFVKQCRFWKLPETVPEPKGVVVDDGDWLTICGRDRDRFHQIRRFVWRETGVDQLSIYMQQISGLFDES